MAINLQEKKYLTPYVAWLNIIGNNEREVNRFIKQVEQLPADTQSILKNFSTAEFIEDKLAPQFNLNSQQVNALVIAIKNLLLGELHGEDFISNIQTSIKIDPETSDQIVDMISKELLGSAIVSSPVVPMGFLDPKIPERPDLKIEPDINRNNIVDLRNK